MKRQKSVIDEKSKDIKEDERSKVKIVEGEVILMDLNFFWSYKEIDKIIAMWENGVDFRRIVKLYKKDNWNTKRKEEEIFLLLLHLAMKGKINKRTGFLWGNDKE